MAELVTEYKCPACNGSMKFDPVSGKVKCEYCDAIYSIEEAKAMVADRNKEVIANAANPSGDEDYWNESDDMKAYSCQSCGAGLVCDETTAATSCPYCGSPTIMPQQFKGMMKPKYIIPFKVLKQDVQNRLTDYCKGKKLLPGSFTNTNHIAEVKGVYVPFWLYSGSVDADIWYKAEKKEVKETATEKITLTHHYQIHRKGVIAFDKVPADASKSMPDDLMDSIEPYDYKEIKNFEMEYLPGYIADKYDVEKTEVIKHQKDRVENSAENILGETIDGYDSITVSKKAFNFMNDKQEYAMFPVWLLSTHWNNENFLFAVNGQTGKMIGNLPIDNVKRIAWTVGTALVIFAALFFALKSVPLAAIVGVVVGLITCFVMTSSMKPVSKNHEAQEYVVKNGKNSSVKLSIKEDKFLNTTEKREAKNTNSNGAS